MSADLISALRIASNSLAAVFQVFAHSRFENTAGTGVERLRSLLALTECEEGLFTMIRSRCRYPNSLTLFRIRKGVSASLGNVSAGRRLQRFTQRSPAAGSKALEHSRTQELRHRIRLGRSLAFGVQRSASPTSHLSPLTSHLSPLTSHLSPLTSHLSLPFPLPASLPIASATEPTSSS